MVTQPCTAGTPSCLTPMEGEHPQYQGRGATLRSTERNQPHKKADTVTRAPRKATKGPGASPPLYLMLHTGNQPLTQGRAPKSKNPPPVAMHSGQPRDTGKSKPQKKGHWNISRQYRTGGYERAQRAKYTVL